MYRSSKKKITIKEKLELARKEKKVLEIKLGRRLEYWNSSALYVQSVPQKLRD